MKIHAYRLHRYAVLPRRAESAGGRIWELVCTHPFEVTWNGGPRAEDVEIHVEGSHPGEPDFVHSQHGHGVLTFHPGYQFKTEEPYALWVGGPTSPAKDGIAPLESLVDTMHLPCTVAVHWQITRAKHSIRFAAGEPFARLLMVPAPRPGGASKSLEFESLEYTDDAAHAQAFLRMVDTTALDSVFLRLGVETAPRPVAALEPATSLPPGCFDTIDGRIDLGRFEPGFFLPECFFVAGRDESLRRDGEVHRREFLVIDELGVVFLPVPKVACTAIKLALAKIRGIQLAAHENPAYHIHSHPKWHFEFRTLRPAQDGYHRFAFVRNPFDRLVSCYRSKILFQASPTGRAPLYQDYYFSLPINIGFDDFVKRVAEIPDALADNHFKSQYALLHDHGELLVDQVGKFERFEADWRPLAEKYGLDPVLEVSNDSKQKPGAHGDYRQYYTEELVQRVYERYRKDVHTFGYEEDYRQLLAFARQRSHGGPEHAKELQS